MNTWILSPSRWPALCGGAVIPAFDDDLAWADLPSLRSENPDVVRAEADGLRAIAPGEATVTATSRAGDTVIGEEIITVAEQRVWRCQRP